MVQWLRLAGGLGASPGQGTRSHMRQLKILRAATKDPMCHSDDQRSRVPQLRPGTAKHNFFLRKKDIPNGCGGGAL